MISPVATQLWITRPVPVRSPRLRLFCFPHVGSGAAQFRAWADLLPNSVEVCAVRLPGRETRMREPALTRLSDIVAATREAMLPLLDVRFAMFGHSMGALLAFEIARSLAAAGDPVPQHLIVSARRAPYLPEPEAPMHKLDEPRFVAELARRYGPQSTLLLDDPELRALFLPVLRADFEAVETYSYVPGEKLPCPITALGGLDDARATEAELSAWRTLTRSNFTLHRFAGDHFFHQALRRQVVARIHADLPT
jgi:medium-chain acyl-[acyl-carrier-protein] hydrolase